MKKIFLILSINILLICSVLLLFEYLSYERYKKIFINANCRKNITEKDHPTAKIEYPYTTKMRLFKIDDYERDYRKPLGKNLNKKSIVIFGCSTAYGENLNENQTLSYKLYKIIKKPVYNRAYSGWAPQHMLCQLRMKNFYSEIGNPQYFIFIYRPDHKRRLFQPQWYLYSIETCPRFKEKNGKLEEIKPFLYKFWGLYSVRHIQELYEKYVSLNPKNEEKTLKLLNMIFEESNRLTKQHFPKSKFIIIKYQDNQTMSEKEKVMWKKIEKSGIKIIDAEKLLKDNPEKQIYKLPDYDGHPNEKVWNIIAPNLAKELNKF